MFINYVNETDKDTKAEEKLINKIFKQFKNRKEIFSIIFVSLEEIRKINKEYRNIDKETAVISFAYNDNEEDIAYSGDEIGDIFICLDIDSTVISALYSFKFITRDFTESTPFDCNLALSTFKNFSICSLSTDSNKVP